MTEDRSPDPSCLFCRIVAGEIPSDTVHADDAVIAIRDIAPRAPTHVLFMPRVHIPSAADLTGLGRRAARTAVLDRGRLRPERGHRVERLSAGDQRRAVGRPDRRPSPRPPARRAVDDVAARMTRPEARGGVGARLVAATASLLVFAVSSAGCGMAASTPALPGSSTSPTPFLSSAASATAGQVEAALRAAGIVAGPSPVPFRPAESPALTAAPRLVLKATLPDDDGQGFIVIYDFPDAAPRPGRRRRRWPTTSPRVRAGSSSRPTPGTSSARSARRSCSTPGRRPRTTQTGAADVATALGTLGLEIPIVR